jgi:hypothetical protein
LPRATSSLASSTRPHRSLLPRWALLCVVAGTLRQPQAPRRHCRVHSSRHLTSPSSGQATAGCACFRLPLMSNVRAHSWLSLSPLRRARSLRAAARAGSLAHGEPNRTALATRTRSSAEVAGSRAFARARSRSHGRARESRTIKVCSCNGAFTKQGRRSSPPSSCSGIAASPWSAYSEL